MTLLNFQLLILSFGLKLASTSDERVIISALNEDASLTCSNLGFKNGPSDVRVRLIRCGAGSHTVVFQWPKKSQKIERVELKADGNGKMCLMMKNVQKSDESLYCLEVYKGWDVNSVENISLKVRECKSLEPEMATVGRNVKLTCFTKAATGGLAASGVQWAKLKGTLSEPVDRANTTDAFLTIQSVSVAHSGWYRCNYSLGQNHRCSDVNLHVREQIEYTSVASTVPVTSPTITQKVFTQIPQIAEKEEDRENSARVIILVVCAIITLCALTGLILYNRRKNNRGTLKPKSKLDHSVNSMEFYENVLLPSSTEPSILFDTVYSFAEETGSTFQT